MRASGMTTAQIANQTQRGAKTIQRVVSGKFSSAPARGSTVATAVAVDGQGGLPPTILQIPPLSRDHGCVERAQTPQTTPSQKHAQQTVTASEMPREAIYTPQAGRTEAVRTSANCEQRTVQNVKLPKRPKKLTRKLTTSTTDFSVNLKQANQSPRTISTTGSLLSTAQSIAIQRPQTSTMSVQPVAARAGCALNSACPATGHDRSARSIGANRQQISVVPAEQATTTARGEQALREPLPSSDAATNPPRFQSQQPVRAESASEVSRQSTTSGGPSVIPVNHLQQLLDETSEQQFVSMANLVSDDDSDDDIHVRSQPQTTATMFAHHQVEAQGTPRQSNTVMGERDTLLLYAELSLIGCFGYHSNGERSSSCPERGSIGCGATSDQRDGVPSSQLRSATPVKPRILMGHPGIPD
jgi:hypothetical protein